MEKLITITSTEADELIALAHEKRVIPTVYQNRRYDSDFLTVQRIVRAGALGTIMEFENRFDHDRQDAFPWYNPNPGDGMAYMLGAHTIAQTVRLFGLPSFITSFERSTRRGCKTDDSNTIILQFSCKNRNVICTLKSSVVSRGPLDKRLKFIIRGTERTFIEVS